MLTIDVELTLQPPSVLQLVVALCPASQNRSCWVLQTIDIPLAVAISGSQSEGQLETNPEHAPKRVKLDGEGTSSAQSNPEATTGVNDDVQVHPCDRKGTYRSCVTCWEVIDRPKARASPQEDECRFMHIRILQPRLSASPEQFRSEPTENWLDGFEYGEWNPPLEKNYSQSVKVIFSLLIQVFFS